MKTHIDKTQENKNQSVTGTISKKRNGGMYAFQFVDNRSETIVQRKLQDIVKNNPRLAIIGDINKSHRNSLHVQSSSIPIQRQQN